MFIIFSQIIFSNYFFSNVQIHVDDYVLNVHVNISGENALTKVQKLRSYKGLR